MWRDLIIGVVAGVVANIVFTLVTLIFILFRPLSNQRRKSKFFGFDKNHTDLVIYLSAVRVDLTKENTQPNLVKGYKGALVGKIESEAANLITAALSDTWLAYFDFEWTDVTGSVAPHIRKLNVDVRTSPDVDSTSSAMQLTYKNMICLGSNLYNAATAAVQEDWKPFFAFKQKPGVDDVAELYIEHKNGTPIAGRSKNRELAYVQRLRNPERKEQMVILCAGTGQRATQGAVRNLLAQWKDYDKAFGREPFGICLQFPHENGDWSDLPIGEEMFRARDERLEQSADLKPDLVRELKFPGVLSFEAVRRHHDCIRQSLIDAAAVCNAAGPHSFALELTHTDSNRQRPVSFDLIHGPIATGSPASLTLSLNAFRELLFLDLGRWKSAKDLADHLRWKFDETTLEHGEGALLSVCENWFLVYKQVARTFFEEANLTRYFEQFVSDWWNKGIEISPNHTAYQRKVERIVGFRDKRVLELGCGYGRLLTIFRGAKQSVHVDASKDLLNVAKGDYVGKNAAFVHADVNNLPPEITESQFDSIVLLQICMHLQKPFEVLEKASRLLSENGEIWVDFTCESNAKQDWYEESFFTRIYSENYIVEKLQNSGFQICERLKTEDRPGHYWLTLRLKNRLTSALSGTSS